MPDGIIYATDYDYDGLKRRMAARARRRVRTIVRNSVIELTFAAICLACVLALISRAPS